MTLCKKILFYSFLIFGAAQTNCIKKEAIYYSNKNMRTIADSHLEIEEIPPGKNEIREFIGPEDHIRDEHGKNYFVYYNKQKYIGVIVDAEKIKGTNARTAYCLDGNVAGLMYIYNNGQNTLQDYALENKIVIEKLLPKKFVMHEYHKRNFIEKYGTCIPLQIR